MESMKDFEKELESTNDHEKEQESMNDHEKEQESMKDYERELESSFRTIQEGDIITGTVVSVGDEEVILDLRYYTQGIIKVENLSNDPDFVAGESLHPGDEIEAAVVRMDDGKGNIELSKKEANDVLAWEKLKVYKEEGTIVKVHTKEAVPAGVIAFLEGIRGFIPASQISADYVEKTDEWVGKELEVKVITVDEKKQKLVMSGRAVAREKKEEERNHRISMLVPGTVLEGTVESLMPYGAFIALGDGISGLVHVSQISQKRIKTPGEVLKEGQKVKVKILNTNDHKVSLSMKALEDEVTETRESAKAQEYVSNEKVSTNLGSLLSKLKL